MTLMEVGKTYYVKWWNDDKEKYWESIFKCTEAHPIYGTSINRNYGYSVELLAVKDPTRSGVWTTRFKRGGSTLILGKSIHNLQEVIPKKRSIAELPDDWMAA